MITIIFNIKQPTSHCAIYFLCTFRRSAALLHLRDIQTAPKFAIT